MVRYREGRPYATSQTENEIMFYFNKIADKPKHYSYAECGEVFCISKPTVHARISEIAKKCKSDESYLQTIKNKYERYNNIKEAIDDIGKIPPQPKNTLEFNTNVVDAETLINNISKEIRDIGFNLKEVNQVLFFMKQIINGNINNNATVIEGSSNPMIHLQSIDDRLSELEDNVTCIIDILQKDNIKNQSQPVNQEKSSSNLFNMPTAYSFSGK